jgi:hypothetical protein
VSRLISRLKERLSEMAHSVLVWCLLHDVGMWREGIGGHADWVQVTYGILSLSVEHCHCVDGCNLRLRIGSAAYAFNVGNEPLYASVLTFSHWKPSRWIKGHLLLPAELWEQDW